MFMLSVFDSLPSCLRVFARFHRSRHQRGHRRYCHRRSCYNNHHHRPRSRCRRVALLDLAPDRGRPTLLHAGVALDIMWAEVDGSS